MKPFRYHEDPLYAAATAILTGQTIAEQDEQLDEYVSPHKTKAQKLQNIKDRRKEHEEAIAKIRKRHVGMHSAERSGDDMRIIDMHNRDLAKLAAREKKIMKMTEEESDATEEAELEEAALTEANAHSLILAAVSAVNNIPDESLENFFKLLQMSLGSRASEANLSGDQKNADVLHDVAKAVGQAIKIASKYDA